MLTSLIEQYADIGGLSSPDINLKVLLRHNVCPAYMADVGFVAWRRAFATRWSFLFLSVQSSRSSRVHSSKGFHRKSDTAFSSSDWL